MDNERRLEILGISLITLSIFIIFSLVGYDPNEQPQMSPNIKVNNPMGIIGVGIAYYFFKEWFGYIMFIIPFIGFLWGWFLFAKKKLDILIRSTIYLLVFMLLISISIGVLSNLLFLESKTKFSASGKLGGVIGGFILDWFKPWGTFLFLISSFLILIRGYFNIDFYAPFALLDKKWNKWKKEFTEAKILKNKEKEKRKHTKKLKAKIDAKKNNNVYSAQNSPHDDLTSVDTFEDSQEIEQSYLARELKADSNVKKNTDDYTSETLSHSNSNNQNILNEFQEVEGKSIDEEAPTTDEDFSLHDAIEKENLQESGKIESNDLNIEEIVENEIVDIDEVVERKKPKRKYQLPSSDLLENPIDVSDNLSRDELIERAQYLTQSMSTFGVEGNVVNVHPGPIITLFEVEPAEGVRVNKFVQLADDLARVMEASSVRVIAPIPGKSSVGIEIPNRNPATVFFKSVVNSSEFAEAESILTLAIGKTTSGEISTLNLAKMPHLLIAGTTGSGKSVCINTIICSILYSATPDEVKFVMIDPKKVEMTLYRQLEGYHLLKMEDISEPIVTSVDNAILALRALEKEMDRRYNVLADALVRNIDEYNQKMRNDNQSIMPYIVLVVDELADLMMLSAKDVEAPIARLAQLSRAVGIHLVIATQRPSVDVITGVIKANFPSRIAFQVASKIDSRTIIDQPGADKLIGRGDMLHLGTGSSDVFRMHNAFLSLDEIEAIMQHIVNQPKAEELILPSVRESQVSELGGNGPGDSGNDDLFSEAVSLVITHQQGSISLLQRRLKVGYSRAARLIDQMEQTGVVGPFTGSKAREVLVDETYLEMIKD